MEHEAPTLLLQVLIETTAGLCAALVSLLTWMAIQLLKKINAMSGKIDQMTDLSPRVHQIELFLARKMNYQVRVGERLIDASEPQHP